MLSRVRQGPLNTWTVHINCQIHSRGDSNDLIALLVINIFLIFLWNYFSIHIKAEGMTQSDIFHVSELRALLFLRSTQTSQNLKFLQKCPCLSSWLERSLFEHGPKNRFEKINPHPAPGCNRSSPYYVLISKRCNSWECSIHFLNCTWNGPHGMV